jgi:hypothetical protein
MPNWDSSARRGDCDKSRRDPEDWTANAKTDLKCHGVDMSFKTTANKEALDFEGAVSRRSHEPRAPLMGSVNPASE